MTTQGLGGGGMIPAPAEKIRWCREQGYWGDRTFPDALRDRVLADPERTALVDHPLEVEMCLRQLGQEKVKFTIMPPAGTASTSATEIILKKFKRVVVCATR